MPERNVAQNAVQEGSTQRNIPAHTTTSLDRDPIQSIYERLGLRALEGFNQIEEEWTSPTTLLLTGTMEMEADGGIVLKVPFSCPIEFGEYSLEIGNMKVSGLTV
jgi:hypothetical protein